MSRYSLDDIADLILVSGLDDDIQAGEVASTVLEFAGISSYQENMEYSMRIIEYLLIEGLMKIGDIRSVDNHARFIGWDLSLQDSISRAKSKWKSLGRRPTLGELFWLVNTRKGNERALYVLKHKPRWSPY